MIEYLADTYYSSLSFVLPMLRDALGASLLFMTFLFPILFFGYIVFRVLKFFCLKKVKKVDMVSTPKGEEIK